MEDLFPFKFFVGVIEDVDDPLQAGHVRVRAFGYHTNDKTVLPTSDLPWTKPLQSTSSASVSGVGDSPVGAVTGSWAVCAWIDPDQQNSFCFGTFSGLVPSASQIANAMVFKPSPVRNLVENKNSNILKDGNGNPVLDSTGNPIQVATPAVDGWTLGQTSSSFESGGHGAGTINAYASSNDFGGASYGTYQYASYLPSVMPNGKSRQNANRSPLNIYLAASRYSGKFVGLTPSTAAFDNAWTSLASSDSNFAVDQHNFIKTNYYDVFCSSLKRNNLDLSGFGIAVQDCIWSTAVQYGANAVSVFITPLKGKSQLTDADIVNLVQQYKYDTASTYFKSSSSAIQQGIQTRCKAEQTKLLALIT